MVAPVGPVALTLVGLGVEQGRRRVVRGAAGVALADAILVAVAGIGTTTVGLFDLPWVDTVSRVLGLVLVLIGVRIAVRSEQTLSLVGGIRRPGTTMLAMTLLNPMSLAIWLAVVAALPAEVLTPSSMAEFGFGVTAASVVWHLGLGLLAAWVGHRVGPVARRWGTLASGVVVAIIGVTLAV